MKNNKNSKEQQTPEKVLLEATSLEKSAGSCLKRRLLIFFVFMTLVCAGAYYVSHYVIPEAHVQVEHPDVVRGEIITLKRLKEKYFIDYHTMFSPIVRKDLEFPERITLDYTIRFLKDEMRKDAAGQTLWYCIFDNLDDKLIGYIEIREFREDDVGQLGCWLNEKYWGQGRIQEALKLISRLYFSLRPHDHYIAHVRLWNKRSYKALKKFGLKDKDIFYENGVPSRYILEMKKEYLK